MAVKVSSHGWLNSAGKYSFWKYITGDDSDNWEFGLLCFLVYGTK